MTALLASLYTLFAVWLAVYGLQSLILLTLFLLHRRPAPPPPPADTLPEVVVQIPVYNELHVVERVIDHVAALDYPRDRLHIQVLDDSTDETTAVAQARVDYHRQRGVDIVLLRRGERTGFKAGALADGLAQATGEYIAIFDADFCPARDFLRRTIPYFLHRPRLGMVQARWGHLDADYSPLTRAQALALDGHFAVEQTARNRSGLLMNFNGSGGIWRRECIAASGGWQADTLCEDLDLSYRAQLAGWECLYLPQVEVPAEVPPQITAFKRQQARWAQGSVQTLRKLAGPLLRSDRLDWAQKTMGLLHLSSYLAHPLMVLLLLVTLPLLTLPGGGTPALGWAGVALGLTGLGPPSLYAVSQWALYPDWRRRFGIFPLLAVIGVGIAWSDTRAVWRGLTRWGGDFARTPKFRLERRGDRWTESRYRLPPGDIVGEVALTAYALATVYAAAVTGNGGLIPFLLLYAVAFGTMAVLGLTGR